MADTIKLIFAVAVLMAAIVLFYTFSEEYSTLLRVLSLLVAAGLSLFIVSRTVMGKTAFSYVKDTQVEVRKVVWPTRQETMQTTMIVIVMVMIAALILWGFDSMLGWTVRALTL